MKTKNQTSGKTISKPVSRQTRRQGRGLVDGQPSILTDRITRKKVIKPKKEHTTEELEAALYEVERDLDSAVLKVLLLGETLRSIKEDNQIKGDKIELGLEKKRLTKEVRSWLNSFGYKIKDRLMVKVFKGVPIEIKIIKRNYSFFKHPDIVFYKAFEVFNIPNPWRNYMKAKGLVR